MSYIKEIPFVLLCVARMRSGKSYSLKHMMYQMYDSKRIEKIFVFSGTSSVNNDYSHIEKKCVTSDYSHNKLKKIVKWQMDRVNKKNGGNIVLIFDDMSDLTEKLSCNLWKKLLSEHRHYKISCIFSIQYINTVRPFFRDLTRYCMIFRTTSKKSIESIYHNFMTEFDSYTECKKFLLEKTKEQYRFLLIDMYADGDDKYKALKAPSELPNYVLKF